MPNYPIILEPEPGTKIKGSFVISGHHVIARNMDIFDTPDTRWTEETGSNPSFVEPEGFSIFGSSLIVTHARVMDIRGNGLGFWQPAINSILYGLWTINNGWDAPDRGHGHGTYTQNQANGWKLIRNCMWAQGYSGGLRAYTTNQSMEAITVDRCISIIDQIFLGGHSPASQCALTNNRVWGDMLEVGETDQDNQDVLIDGNYVSTATTDGASGIILRYWKTPTVTNNSFIQRSTAPLWQVFPHTAPAGVTINNNTYYVADLDAVFAIVYTPNGSGGNISTYYTITQWQALGYDVDSTFIEGVPTTNVVFIEPSEYDNDIAHVAIYNWEGLTSALADFSATSFTLTETYRAYNAMNPNEYYEFVYAGVPVLLPMTGWTVAIPSGATEPLHPGSWPDFIAFVVKIAP